MFQYDQPKRKTWLEQELVFQYKLSQSEGTESHEHAQIVLRGFGTQRQKELMNYNLQHT